MPTAPLFTGGGGSILHGADLVCVAYVGLRYFRIASRSRDQRARRTIAPAGPIPRLAIAWGAGQLLRLGRDQIDKLGHAQGVQNG